MTCPPGDRIRAREHPRALVGTDCFVVGLGSVGPPGDDGRREVHRHGDDPMGDSWRWASGLPSRRNGSQDLVDRQGVVGVATVVHEDEAPVAPYKKVGW